ncbi:ParB/RepB/Spo0J family partition protein [Robbsia sp. Bb-Pol-6]|uniref:ParB/RepB/Spo0J family partition protein n=1 Tax=Robbsia betulipollinis TaxID=2981849 RepID=A0ABT3ZJS7_9BURK|nr:ParB/RepB/Spo0J family partition protein [Robbsia betulipollinis]MCY0386784.1 ParB/RepB/Spo0J family partition protein [Robbsia betulipollinis]
MAKSMKAMLEARAAENTKRHHEAVYADDFDVGRQHVKVEVEGIERNPYQPRIHYAESAVQELALSIEAVGLLQPITLRKVDDRYQLIAGERRLRAHKVLGRTHIEALVISANDEESALLALAENMDRADLSDFEIGLGIRQIQLEFPHRTKLAEHLRIQRSDLYRYLAFDALPDEVKDRLRLNPALISRSAATDIVKALKEGEGTPEERLGRLRKAWEKLEAGKLEQSKVARFVARPHAEASGKPRPVVLYQKGERIGSITAGDTQLVVKIATAALSEDQRRQLSDFVVDLFR